MWTSYMSLTYKESPLFWTHFVEISTLLIFIKFVAPCRFSTMLIHKKSYIKRPHEWAYSWSPQTWNFRLHLKGKFLLKFIIFFYFLLNFKEGLRLPCLPHSVSDLLYSLRQEFGHSLSIVNENNDRNSERITKDVKGITEFRVVTGCVIEISSTHTHTHTHTHTPLPSP